MESCRTANYCGKIFVKSSVCSEASFTFLKFMARSLTTFTMYNTAFLKRLSIVKSLKACLLKRGEVFQGTKLTFSDSLDTSTDNRVNCLPSIGCSSFYHLQIRKLSIKINKLKIQISNPLIVLSILDGY